MNLSDTFLQVDGPLVHFTLYLFIYMQFSNDYVFYYLRFNSTPHLKYYLLLLLRFSYNCVLTICE
jgi:hypothetical protein